MAARDRRENPEPPQPPRPQEKSFVGAYRDSARTEGDTAPERPALPRIVREWTVRDDYTGCCRWMLRIVETYDQKTNKVVKLLEASTSHALLGEPIWLPVPAGSNHIAIHCLLQQFK